MFLMFKLKASVLRQFDDQNSRRNTSISNILKLLMVTQKIEHRSFKVIPIIFMNYC